MTQHPNEPPGASPGRRVLLVEDNLAACKGLTKLLEAHGYEVTTAYDGATALQALATGSPPDFVLTDLQLPDLDGREVARQARQLVPPPRVALITGWDLEPHVDHSSAWGIDWVLTKPVDFQELISKLQPPPGPGPTSDL